MNLLLERVQIDDDVTIGSLSIEGEWQCWTCEDVVRADGVKVPGQTAIPFGRYPVVISWSPRFGRDLPLLESVPNFTGVRIHPGNTAADTEGCILPGLDRHPKSVGRSRKAFDALYAQIAGAIRRRDSVHIEIVRAP